MSPQRLSSKVAILQESALSAVEAAADAVIGEDDADDHHEDKNDLDNHDSDKIMKSSGLAEGDGRSFQDAANSVMEAAGAIAGHIVREQISLSESLKF